MSLLMTFALSLYWFDIFRIKNHYESVWISQRDYANFDLKFTTKFTSKFARFLRCNQDLSLWIYLRISNDPNPFHSWNKLYVKIIVKAYVCFDRRKFYSNNNSRRTMTKISHFHWQCSLMNVGLFIFTSNILVSQINAINLFEY